MTNTNVKQKPTPQEPLRPVAGQTHSSDWFYDELMTAQPDATREFYRLRLVTPAPRDDDAL